VACGDLYMHRKPSCKTAASDVGTNRGILARLLLVHTRLQCLYVARLLYYCLATEKLPAATGIPAPL
jgi:hypothetical protein